MNELTRADATLGAVIVCDDDDLTREALSQNLSADRFEAMPAPTAKAALELSRDGQADLLLLDLVLPDLSGLEVLRLIRGREAEAEGEPSLPVVLVSGRSSERDRIRCFDSGADAFIPKPASYPELLAQIKSILRRRQERQRSRLRIGGLVIDRVTRRVTVDGRPVALSRKEYLMLCVLAESPDRVVSKEELHYRVWGHESLRHSRTLETHISRLRCKLDPVERRFVINSWGVGYQLCEEAAR